MQRNLRNLYVAMLLGGAQLAQAAEPVYQLRYVIPDISTSVESSQVADDSVPAPSNMSIEEVFPGDPFNAGFYEKTYRLRGVPEDADAVDLVAMDVNGKTFSVTLTDNRLVAPNISNDDRWAAGKISARYLYAGDMGFYAYVTTNGALTKYKVMTIPFEGLTDGIITMEPITGDGILTVDERTGVDKMIQVTGHIKSGYKLLMVKGSVGGESYGWEEVPRAYMPAVGGTFDGTTFNMTYRAVDFGSDIDDNFYITYQYEDEFGVVGSSHFGVNYVVESDYVDLFQYDESDPSKWKYVASKLGSVPSREFYQTVFDGDGSFNRIYRDQYALNAPVVVVSAGSNTWEQYHYISAGVQSGEAPVTIAGASLSSISGYTPERLIFQYQAPDGTWKGLYQMDWPKSSQLYYEVVFEHPVEALAARIYYYHRDQTKDTHISNMTVMGLK